MRKVRYLLCTLLVAIAIFSFSIPATAAVTGTISGQVVNKTAGGSAIGALQVTLTPWVDGKPATNIKQATVDSSGKFSFAGLSVEAGTAYVVSTRFQDADYEYVDVTSTSDYPDQISLTTEKPTVTIELGVFDSTTSDAAISVSSAHLILEDSGGALQVIEVWRFLNTGDKTFIGAGTPKQTLKFTLPSGATSFSPGQGFLPVATTTGMADTMPVLPGNTDVNYAYVIPYSGKTLTFTRKADYATAGFGILVKDSGLKVTSVLLTNQGPLDMGTSTKYILLDGKGIPKGADIDLSFSNLGATSDVSSGSGAGNDFIWPIVAAVLALALVAAIAIPRMKRPTAFAANTGQTSQNIPGSQGLPDEKGLLQELARLDDDFEAGRIKEADYREQRSAAKSKLIELYGQNKGSGR